MLIDSVANYDYDDGVFVIRLNVGKYRYIELQLIVQLGPLNCLWPSLSTSTM